jgi:N-methylhydantoinase A
MLCAPVSFDLARSLNVPLAQARWTEIDRLLEEMTRECRQRVAEAGVAPQDIVTSRSVDIRYSGQGHELQINLDGLSWPEVRGEDVLNRFRAEYERLNAVKGPDAPLELITWRASARGPVAQLPLRAAAKTGAPAARSHRPVYFGERQGFVNTVVVARDALSDGETLPGPALIELGDATITIGPDASASVRDDGLIEITLTY